MVEVMGEKKNKQNEIQYVTKGGKKFCRFYLINPKHMHISIDALADQLIGMKEVQEIYLNDSNKNEAFDVMVRFNSEMATKDIKEYIKNRLSSKFGEFSSSRKVFVNKQV